MDRPRVHRSGILKSVGVAPAPERKYLMSRRKLLLLIAVPAVVVAGVVAFRIATVPMYGDPHVHEPAAIATAADASEACGIPLPPEARNIRVAGWSQWIAHEDYLRFEAPVAVCLRHAAVLVPGTALAPVSAEQLALEARRRDRGILRDLSWFDLGAARNVVGAGGGSQCPRVWVDQVRGVLYYRLTD